MERPIHTARVVVVGSSNMDMVARTERLPAPGETVLGSEFVMTPGGKGANQAVAAARLGAEVTFVSRVGTDVFGERITANIAAAGIRTEYIVHDDGAPSGVALIFVEKRGQNAIVVAQGANARLTPEDVDAARPAFEQADVIMVQFEIPLPTVAHTIALAQSLGKQIVLSPAPMLPLPSDFLRGVDVVICNHIEAGQLIGEREASPLDAVDRAQRLLSKGIGAAIVTMGNEGAAAATRTRVQRIPPKHVAAVDSTAAGDCFAGAVAYSLAEGQEIGPAVYFANAAAALSVTRLGAQASLPTRQEVELFIQQR